MDCLRCGTRNEPHASQCRQCGLPLQDPDALETLATPSSHAAQPAAGSATPAGGSAPSAGAAPSRDWPDFGTRYRVEALLGEGGMGTVYKAYDQDLNRYVALKLVRSSLMASAEATQRFKQELLLASRVTHKNVLRIHDLGDAAGLKFVSMAYVDGEDLYRLIQRRGPLPIDEATRIARQLCDALQAAHAEGVVHRDLKPQNVLLDKSGTAYVTDFGLAKSIESDETMLTGTGQVLGTPRYMAPEQVECKPVDARTDVYALGLIMYEMATADVPFSAGSSLQMMFARVQNDARDPREINPSVPEYYARICLRCLERDRALRYGSAAEVAADLDTQTATASDTPRAVSGTRVTERPVQPAAQPAAHARRLRGWIFAAVLVVVAGLGGGAMWRMRHAQPDVRSVAVLPFKVVGEGESLNDVAEGMRDALSAKLGQLGSIRLAPSSGVDIWAQKTPPLPPDQLAQKLGATLLIRGAVQGTGEKVRVQLTLEDMKNPSASLPVIEVSGFARDILTLEDEAYKRVSDALRVKTTSEELARASAHPTENIDAYDLYLRGRAAMHGGKTLQDAQNASRYYKQALEKDPSFALAYAGLAISTLQTLRLTKDQQYASEALAAAQQAERLDEKLPDAYIAVGTVLQETGHTAEAVAKLRRAVELAPHSDQAWGQLAHAYMANGDKAAAFAAFKKAIDANPYYWLNHYNLGQAYEQSGDHESARREFERVVALDPQNGPGVSNLGIVLFNQGKLEEAIPYFQKAASLTNNRPGEWSNLGEVYFYLKRYDEAIAALQKAVDLNPSVELSVGNLADAYRWSGRKDQANELYQKAIGLALKDLQLNPRSATSMGHLAQYYAKTGDTTQALRFIARARAIDANDVDLLFTETMVETIAGETDQALRSLREALQKGYSPKQAALEPEFGPLRSRPEFATMVNHPGSPSSK